MLNNQKFFQKQILIKEIKKDIKEINTSIDNNLFIILDYYQEATHEAEKLILDICQINKKIISEQNYNKNFTTNYNFDKYLKESQTILDKLIDLKTNTIEKDILEKKLNKNLSKDLLKIRFIEFNLEKIDKKTSLLCGSISLINIIKKINDFKNFILNDFKENYENKIYNIFETITQFKHKNTNIENNDINEEQLNDNSSNRKISKTPKIYKNKRLNCKELAKIALDNNFILSRQNGDHNIFKHKENNKIVVIPYKGNSTLAPKTQKSILNMIFG